MFKGLYLGLLIGCFAIASSAGVSSWDFVWTKTDFSKTSVDFNTIVDGGPGKDGIPAILNPRMISVSQEDGLNDHEPVMTLSLDGQVERAYPVRYLMFHEIVNDHVGDVAFAVTFCPLCSSGVVFDRRLGAKTYTLGVSGMLRNSDMIMYDRETESWWQQFSGEAIVGDMLGAKLTKLPSWMESWSAFKARNPNGLVQSRPKSQRAYGQNPYVGYDTGKPFLYFGEMPPHGINPMARVIVVGEKAWPMLRVKKTGQIKEAGIEISWVKGTTSALDARAIAQGRDVGSIRVRDANGKDIVHDVSFAFAFHAFHPDGKWMLGR